MRRNRDTGIIYLLSLDTFMLMSVLGITVGMIFIILNPSVKLLSPPPREDINYKLPANEFNDLSKCILEEEKIDDNYWEIEGKNEIVYNVTIEMLKQNRYSITVEVYQKQKLIKDEKIMIKMINDHPCLRQYLQATE